MIYPDNFESKIGFDRIKSQIKALCVTQGAADKLSEAEFSNDYDTVVRRLEQTYEMRTALMLESGFPDGSFVDTEPFLKKAAVIGAFLDVEEIVALRKGLSTVHALVAFFGGREDGKYPRLRELCRDVSGFPAIINHIDSIVDKFGRIRDNASRSVARSASGRDRHPAGCCRSWVRRRLPVWSTPTPRSRSATDGP